SKNFYRTLSACRGDYIAICEGDDYWTNELKLQKQVTILETNPAVALVSAKADSRMEGEFAVHSEVNFDPMYKEGFFGIEGLVEEWKCQTLTVMFRREMTDFNKLKSYHVLYDTMLYYELLKKGKGYYLDEVVGVYRHHSEGAWHGKTEQQKLKFIISQFYEIWSKNKKDITIQNKLAQSLTDYLRGVTVFSSKERKYYLQSIVRYLRVTKDFKYLKLLFINHVRHLRGN
ncbi:MAG: glycosyltransferase, partial [Chitinophagaceae bacterium]|nr:glycosyltransferase [Chitinophagaceae bacterium]